MSNTLKVAVAVVFLSTILPAVAVGFDDGRTLQTRVETTTVSYGTDYEVSAAGLYSPTFYDNETVNDTTTGGPDMVEGTDYDFFTSNGTLRIYNTAATSSGDTVRISYNTTAPTQELQYVTTAVVVVGLGFTFMVAMIGFAFAMTATGIWQGEGGG